MLRPPSASHIRGFAAIFCTLWVTATITLPSRLPLHRTALVIRRPVHVDPQSTSVTCLTLHWVSFHHLELLRFSLIPHAHNINLWPYFQVPTLRLPTADQKVKLCVCVCVCVCWEEEAEKTSEVTTPGLAGLLWWLNVHLQAHICSALGWLVSLKGGLAQWSLAWNSHLLFLLPVSWLMEGMRATPRKGEWLGVSLSPWNPQRMDIWMSYHSRKHLSASTHNPHTLNPKSKVGLLPWCWWRTVHGSWRIWDYSSPWPWDITVLGTLRKRLRVWHRQVSEGAQPHM